MYVLGLGTHVTCGSVLIKDGRVVAAVNDERLVRKKMVFGFPRESIVEVLKLANIKSTDIDYVAVATKRQHLVDEYVDYLGGKFKHKRGIAKQIFFDAGSRLSRYLNTFPILEDLYYFFRQPFFYHRRSKIKKILEKEFDIRCPVEFVEHHLCHAACAFYSSQYENATVVTLDSAGDGLCSQVYRFSNNRWQKFNEVSSFNSPSSFYSYVTQLGGFKAGKHEGKITGLAAYGKPKHIEVFKKLIVYEEGTFRNIGGVFFQSALKAIRDALPKTFKREDLAATIQTYLEHMIIDYIGYWLERTGSANVALAGGVFANVLINQKIYEIPGVQSVHVHPGMSDEGIGMGAALALYYEKSSADKTVCFDQVYLGPGFSDEEIQRELDKEGIEYRHCDHVESEIAGLLASGYVVARFNEKMEYGPRALGNRSILYQPTDSSVNDWLNAALQRTEFMPFAPSTIIDDASLCYIGLDGAEDAARFMTITFDCTEWMKRNCPGVVHIDGTARPQLVRREDNPSFYTIIGEYKNLTGRGTIINTSFNIHEEPIVCTPSDAIRAFRYGNLDYLAIGSFIVKCEDEITHSVKPTPALC